MSIFLPFPSHFSPRDSNFDTATPSHPIGTHPPPFLSTSNPPPPSFLVHSSLSNPLEGSSWEGGKSRFDWIFGTSKEKGAIFLGARYCYFLLLFTVTAVRSKLLLFFPLYKTGKYNVCSIVPHKRGRESLQMRGKAPLHFLLRFHPTHLRFPIFRKSERGIKRGGGKRGTKKVLKYKGKWRTGTKKKA